MKLDTRRYAPAGLAISLLAALAAGGLYIIRQKFDLWVQMSLALIVIGIALAVLFDPERTRQALTGRQARFGSNTVIIIIAFTGILVVLNFVAFKETRRWDLTADQQHTLSKESLNVLKTIQSPVFAEAFYTPRMDSSTASKLLDTYKYAAKGKFDYRFVDPEQDPVEAKKADVTRDGTIVLTLGNQMEQVTYAGEQDITSALIKLAHPGKRVLYFLTGHGEFDIDPSSSSPNLYSKAAGILENKGYTLRALDLVNTSSIPQDALAVVIAGPRKPLSSQEVDLLKSYAVKGGSLVVLAEPRPFTDDGDQEDPLAEYLASAWGVKLEENLIVDPGVNPPSTAAADKYEQHPITEKMQGIVTVFPTARGLIHANVPSAVDIVDLIETSANVWGETDYKKISDNTYLNSPPAEMQGPLVVAAAATTSSSNARLVVVGDADFASDTYFDHYGNGDLIINMIDWAAAQDNLINLTPKEPIQRMIAPPQQNMLGWILFGTVFLVPGSVLFSGIATWIQRKRKA